MKKLLLCVALPISIVVFITPWAIVFGFAIHGAMRDNNRPLLPASDFWICTWDHDRIFWSSNCDRANAHISVRRPDEWHFTQISSGWSSMVEISDLDLQQGTNTLRIYLYRWNDRLQANEWADAAYFIIHVAQVDEFQLPSPTNVRFDGTWLDFDRGSNMFLTEVRMRLPGETRCFQLTHSAITSVHVLWWLETGINTFRLTTISHRGHTLQNGILTKHTDSEPVYFEVVI